MANPFRLAAQYVLDVFSGTAREYAAAEKTTDGDTSKIADRVAREAMTAARDVTAKPELIAKEREASEKFMMDLAHQAARPGGRQGLRIKNRIGDFVTGGILGQFGFTTNRPKTKAPKVTEHDLQVDELAKKHPMKGVESAIGAYAPTNLKNTSFSEATTRAFIKVSEDSGLTLDEIKKLLEHNAKTVDGHFGKEAEFEFSDLSKENESLFEKIKEKFNVSEIVSQMTGIDLGNTKDARQKRAQKEHDAKPEGPSQWNPTELANSVLDKLTSVIETTSAKAAEVALQRFDYTIEKRSDGTITDGTIDAVSQEAALKTLNENNVDSIVSVSKGQEIAKRVPDNDENANSSLTKFMTTFSQYMGIDPATDDEKIHAEENLTDAIDKLIDAIEKKEGTDKDGNPKKASWVGGKLKKAALWTGMKLARGAAKVANPVLSKVAKLVPQKLRSAAKKWGANKVAMHAQKMGVSPAVAARFGAALGGAAVALGAFTVVVGVIGSVISALNALADKTWESVLNLADYNGHLAYGKAQLEFNRELRKFAMAEALAKGNLLADSGTRFQAANFREDQGAKFDMALAGIGLDIGSLKDTFIASIWSIGNEFIGLMKLTAGHIVDIFDGWGESEEAKRLKKEGLDLMNPFVPAAQPANQMWEGADKAHGANSVDAQDLARRLAGPRRPMGKL